MSVAEGLAAVREQVRAAAVAAGRDPAEVTLVAVSKLQPLAALMEAYDAGMRDFGESTAQELDAKAEAMAKSGRTPRWHFIGKLQRNKVNVVLRHAGLVQTVDRAELAEALERRTPAGARTDVLVQVNIGAEPQKGGVPPEDALTFARAVAVRPALRLRGLMAIPPANVDPVPHFTRLRELWLELRAEDRTGELVALSMGMSQDFVQAIHCGATMVRVGSAIFGERPRQGHP